jgi:hypothetical protein
MMLFTKDIDKKLFQQYDMGSNLEKQKVIAKIFNPYGNSRWFLINSDPNDSNYIWAIVQMGDIVEVGSVSRKALETARVGRFRFPLERDLGFIRVNAAELFRGLNQGKFYADGGSISTFNPMELIGKYFIGKFSYGDITNIRIISDENIRIEYQTNNGLIVDKSFTKKQLFDMVNGKKIDDNIIVKPSKPMADGGETEVEEEQTVTRGFYEDEPYEYAKGGDVKWQDARIGDSARVKSENKMGVIKKDYGRKFHLKFVDGTEKTYDASELEFLKDNYADDGDTDEGVDLFEDYENIPSNVQKVLDKYEDAFMDGSYSGLKQALKAVEKIGYTFEYSYDGGAYDLRPIGTKGKSEDDEDYAKGGEITPYIVWVSKDGEKREFYGEYKSMRAANMKMDKLWESGEYKRIGNKPKSMYEKEGFYADGGYMAMGAKVTFDDKVSSIKKSLLKKKTVSPKVQKDYGKTYNKKEALESAQRIAGAMRAKYKK